MGKTSVAQELGRRLEAEGWVFLFAYVEEATCAEDAIADIVQAAHSVRPIMSLIPVSSVFNVSQRVAACELRTA